MACTISRGSPAAAAVTPHDQRCLPFCDDSHSSVLSMNEFQNAMVVRRDEPFGTGRVEVATLTNANGMEVTCMNRGGVLLSIRVPDRDGELADVVLGHADLTNYTGDRHYLGALIGRHANRIADGR